MYTFEYIVPEYEFIPVRSGSLRTLLNLVIELLNLVLSPEGGTQS
jgi:hypothetical protein